MKATTPYKVTIYIILYNLFIYYHTLYNSNEQKMNVHASLQDFSSSLKALKMVEDRNLMNSANE